MWWFDGVLGLDPQTLIAAQLVVEALLVVMVGTLLWHGPRRQGRRMDAAAEGTMAATENLLRRLDEKRRAVESAVETVRAKAPGAIPKPEPGGGQAQRPGLEQAARLAARGLSSAQIARQLGVPRAEVEMYLSLRGGMGARP